ncbi:uncharacterized protein LAJ45_07684 [Morchella importuna]|nr:uncharacterized protein LAJ45_07684 [Morchella importuna]KAH8148232.1 hypothetical protein LAJ45_07684 [Morchella importuna]
MEAVGLAASIIAITQLSSKLLSITYNYISNFQKAPRDIKNLASELHALVGVLDNLKDYLDANPSSPALQKLAGNGGPIEVFTEEMNALHRKFSAIDSSKLTAKLGWPLKDKDITQTLSSVERHKTVFIFAMNVDQLSLSKAIEVYFIDIKKAVEYINTCVKGTAPAVQEIKEDVKNTATTVQEIKSDVGGTNVAIQALQSTQDAEARLKVLNWLYPESFETRHLDISRRRRERTGEWLLKSPEFCEFVSNNQNSPILWGYGIPGAGKTFLSSAVIKLTKAANGMFLLVHFHINLICQQTTPRKLMAELERLTLDGSRSKNNPLDPTYDRAIESIRSQPADFELAKSIFTWLVKAQRTLTVDEIQIAVSMEPDIRELEEDDLPSKKTLLDACAGLVVIDEKSGIVRLAHYTVQEYLLRVLLIPEEANLYIVTSSISFLMLDIFGGKANSWPEYDIFGRKAKINYWKYIPYGSRAAVDREDEISSSETIFQWPEDDFPFLGYIVTQLPFHLRQCDENWTTELILKLFEDQHRVELYSLTRSVYLRDRTIEVYGWHFNGPVPKQSQLQLLSIIGHFSALRIALEQEDDVMRRYDGYTALHFAANEAHVRVARLLIDHGADVSAEDWDQKTPLHKAAEGGHLEIARLLIDHGADVSAEDEDQKTPLHKAAEGGHLEIARLLIDRGADVSAKDGDQETPLHLAAEGDLEIARLLIDRGADVSAKDWHQTTPLHLAAEGDLEIARLLIDRGADVSAKDWDQRTPLHGAAEGGHLEIARLLIDRGADVSAEDSYQKTPLYKALEWSHLEISRLLIDRGTDVSAEDGCQRTPLKLAEILVQNTQHNPTRKREHPEESEQSEARKRRTLLENRPSPDGQSSNVLPSIDSVMDMGWW